jgi:hypothetical protein
MKKLQSSRDNKSISREAFREMRTALEVQILEDLLHDEKISPQAFEYLTAHPKWRMSVNALSRKHRGGPQVLQVTTVKSAAKSHNLGSLRPHAHKVAGGLPVLGKRP